LDLKLPQVGVDAAIKDLLTQIHKLVERPRGLYRTEDLISAAAAFVGECVMRQAGDFDFDDHSVTPGHAIFSVEVNQILSGDRSEWTDIPITSAFGGLRHVLANQPVSPPLRPFPLESFPNVGRIYEHFASERGDGVSKAQYGKAPLSVPAAHFPVEHMPPLRAAFELRRTVAQKWLNESVSGQIMTVIGQAALMTILNRTQQSIPPDIALTIAFETLNAIAKTAPMLPKHLDIVRKRIVN
jgi:hypothetical protein